MSCPHLPNTISSSKSMHHAFSAVFRKKVSCSTPGLPLLVDCQMHPLRSWLAEKSEFLLRSLLPFHRQDHPTLLAQAFGSSSSKITPTRRELTYPPQRLDGPPQVKLPPGRKFLFLVIGIFFSPLSTKVRARTVWPGGVHESWNLYVDHRRSQYRRLPSKWRVW
jgi:hypothetical protein